ncbi:MAG: Lrp/AsnC family transcriptional regulator [Mogibacterium sp.]|nr:Lrp/AsnC family transcriptional regulator [Mogibacterium sp.]
MDEMDVQILNLLKMNARMSLKDLSSEIHLTAPALSARIEKLEAAGYIKGYYADIDLDKLGYKIKAFIQLSVLPEDQRKFYDFIQREDCILECSHITGPFSMLLKVVFPSTADLDVFIGRLQEFGRTETQVVFSTVLERH